MVWAKLFLIISISTAAISTLPDGFSQIGNTVQVSVLSKQEADRLFQEFASRTDIPFDYAIDGCYARATAMTRIAEDQKIEMAKIWAEGDLRAKPKDKTQEDIEWGYHVAPVAYVNENGKNIVKVFDPSLFDRPVSVTEWKSAMVAMESSTNFKQNSWLGRKGFVATVNRTYYSERYQYNPRYIETKKFSWHREDLEDAKAKMTAYSEIAKKVKLVRSQEKRQEPNNGGK